MTLRAAAEQALDTLEHVQAHIGRYDPPVVTTIARAMQPTIDALRAALAAEQPQPVGGWQPIETAPRDNKRPLYLAKFDEKGELQAIDFDASWEFWQESWEMPHINGWDWVSANGIEEPTHWAYQDEGAPPPPAPAEQPQPACPDCGGTGLRDSGGIHPWGEAAMIPCDCSAPPPPAAAPSEAELPPLPHPTVGLADPSGRWIHYYTAEQMRDYALRAAAATRNTNPA